MAAVPAALVQRDGGGDFWWLSSVPLVVGRQRQDTETAVPAALVCHNLDGETPGLLSMRFISDGSTLGNFHFI